MSQPASRQPQPLQPKSIIILAQFFIAFMMAFLMTGIFTAFPMDFAPGWIGHWMKRFATAMPIAFALSLAVGPLSFKLSALVHQRLFRLK